MEQGEALPMKAYWLTCQMCTVSVETDDNNVITKTPPIARKFIGQPLADLKRWMAKYGGFRVEPIAGQSALFSDGETTPPSAA